MRNTNDCKKVLQTNFNLIPGPIKIKDGLYLGDEITAKNINFIIGNKVTHIINTASEQIPNIWQKFGLQYLSLNWTQKQFNIFDKRNNNINKLFNFIEEAVQKEEGCLIHSKNGNSRASVVAIIYLIKKYNWSLTKCVQFLKSKKRLVIRPVYMAQLQQLEKKIRQALRLSSSWKQYQNQQQQTIANTFINSYIPNQKPTKPNLLASRKRVTFNEEKLENKLVPNIVKTDKASVQKIYFKPILKQTIKNGQSQNLLESSPLLKRYQEKNILRNANRCATKALFNNFIKQSQKFQMQYGKNQQYFFRKQRNTDRREREYKETHLSNDLSKQKKFRQHRKNRLFENIESPLSFSNSIDEGYYYKKQQKNNAVNIKQNLIKSSNKGYLSKSLNYQLFK